MGEILLTVSSIVTAGFTWAGGSYFITSNPFGIVVCCFTSCRSWYWFSDSSYTWLTLDIRPH